jgi:hypothetical protein
VYQYLRNMKQDKTWGGNIELQAMSLLFQINIAIHQLNSPRWEIVNFAGGKTIHLSYHDGDHYASGTCSPLPFFGLVFVCRMWHVYAVCDRLTFFSPFTQVRPIGESDTGVPSVQLEVPHIAHTAHCTHCTRTY